MNKIETLLAKRDPKLSDVMNKIFDKMSLFESVSPGLQILLNELERVIEIEDYHLVRVKTEADD